MFMCIFLIIVGAIAFFWVFGTSTHDYWKKLGIIYIKPTPFFGNIMSLVLMKQAVHEIYDQLYKLIDKLPYGGHFEMRTPVLVLKEPALVQRILVTDFNNFRDRGFSTNFMNMNRKLNPLNENIFLSTGHKWKTVRQKMSPIFTAGKLKGMQTQIFDCLSGLIDQMDIGMTDDGKKIDLKIILAQFMVDVIGTCTFGIECNAIGLKNELRIFNAEMQKPRLSMLVKSFLSLINKKLLSVFQLADFPPQCTEFFQNLVYDTMLYRRKNNLRRDDLLQQLMDMQNEAVNPKFSIDFPKKSLSEDETVRKYSSLLLLHRQSLENYVIPETGLKLKRGDHIHIPVWSLHHDWRYYPNPNLFDPERFSDGRKQPGPPGTFIPFGDGPHNCIGKRFVRMVMKLTLSKILILFHFTPCSKTEIPLTYQKSPFLLIPQNGVWLNIKKREES